MKLSVLSLVLALSVAGSAFAAGGAETSSFGPDGPMVIEVFQWGPRDVAADDQVVAFINERLNIDLQISRILAREYTQNLEVKIAAGDIPDLFRLQRSFPQVYQNLYRDNYLANVSDYAQRQNLGNLQRWFTEPGVEEYAEADGFYRVPSRITPRGAVGNMLYRSDWVDRLGLDLPTTNDEFVEFLRAVVTARPGGDNTVALTGVGIGPLEGFTLGFTDALDWKLVDGEYTWVRTLPSYREGLRFVRDLYSQGLVDREIFTLNETQSRGKFVGGTAFIAFPHGGTWDRHPQYAALLAENNPDGVVSILDPRPAGPEGIVYGGFYGLADPWVVPKRGQREDMIERVVTLLDYVHSEEGVSVLLNGVEGIHYVLSDGERVTTDAHTRDIIPGLGHLFAMSTDYSQGKLDINETVNRSREIATQYAVYNPLSDVFSGEAYVRYIPQMNEVHEQWFTDFVTGVRDLDRDWGAYITALRRVGLDQVTQEVNAELQ